MEHQGDAPEERDAYDTQVALHGKESGGCRSGHVDSRRRRPISVIGGVDLFASPDEKEDADLPSVRFLSVI